MKVTEFDVWDLDFKNSEGEWELFWRADVKEDLHYQLSRVLETENIKWVETSAFDYPIIDGKRDFNVRLVERRIGYDVPK